MAKQMVMKLALLALTLVVSGTVACSGPVGKSAPAEAIEVKVELAKYPKLYEPVLVTVTLTDRDPLNDVPNAEAWLELDPKALYVAGDLTWSGDLRKGEPVSFSATLAFVEEGFVVVGARLWAPGGHGGDGDLFLEVHKDGSGPPGPPVYTGIGGYDPNAPVRPLLSNPASPLLRVVTSSSADTPLFFVIGDQKEFEAAQAAGLLPQELRFQWRELFDFKYDPCTHNPDTGEWICRSLVDFSEAIIVGVRASSGAPLGHIEAILWDHGVVKVQAVLKPTPAEIQAPALPTLELALVGKEAIGDGPREFLFQGASGELQRLAYEIK